MANLLITKDESLKAPLEAHDMTGGSQRFSLWANTSPDTSRSQPRGPFVTHSQKAAL